MKRYFFGRREELKKLREKFFVREPGSGYCGAITGANDVGKTLLVREAAREFEAGPHPNVYYFSTAVESDSSYWGFWANLVREFSYMIPEEKLNMAPFADDSAVEFILEAYAFFTDRENLDRMDTHSFASDAVHYLNFLFKYYTVIGIHILISIDEFDRASTAFPVESGDGSFFQNLFKISPKQMELSLSIILISRRRIGTIAHHMAGGSDLESAYPPFIVLRGFKNDELNEYFESYADIMDVPLTEKQQQGIIYFCGRHPGQLMRMRTLYENYGNTTEEVSPAVLYRDYGEPMQTIYERMNTLMRTEYVDADKKQNCVGTFSQVFVGPAYDPNIKSRIEQLFKYGLLSKWDSRNEKNVFQLAGLPYDAEAEAYFEYEPMSPYYIEFFKARVLPDERDTLGRLMENAEQAVRNGILRVLKQEHPDRWEEILAGYTSDSKSYYREYLDTLALRNDADARNIFFTNLDVMAFNDYARIIVAYWDAMRRFFRSYKTPEALKSDFRCLNEYRNCFAHNNAKILDEQSCTKLKKLCNIILADYDLGDKGIAIESGSPTPATAATAAGEVRPSDQQIQELLASGEKVVFCFQQRKASNGNFRGFIKGYGYPASISRAKQEEFGFTDRPVKGDEFEARILRWDFNAGMFNLGAPDAE